MTEFVYVKVSVNLDLTSSWLKASAISFNFAIEIFDRSHCLDQLLSENCCLMNLCRSAISIRTQMNRRVKIEGVVKNINEHS